MTCTEEYREHIEYTFHAFCKVVIRNATINAARTRSRKHKREISLEYLTDEKHYICPKRLGTSGRCWRRPARSQSGAQKLAGHDIMALERFDPDTRHMIILDVLPHESPMGWKREKMLKHIAKS